MQFHHIATKAHDKGVHSTGGSLLHGQQRENYTVIPCLSSFLIWEQSHIQHFPASAKLQTVTEPKKQRKKIDSENIYLLLSISKY